MDDIGIPFSDTEGTALESGRMLRAAVVDGKGKWQYLGPLRSLGE